MQGKKLCVSDYSKKGAKNELVSGMLWFVKHDLP